ncbi:hypothetical protein P3S68_033524 [Capsicum galapagoense]
MPHIHRSVDSAWENRGYDTGANCQNSNIVGVAPVFWAREGWCGGSALHPLSKRLRVRSVNGENFVVSSLPHTSCEWRKLWPVPCRTPRGWGDPCRTWRKLCGQFPTA